VICPGRGAETTVRRRFERWSDRVDRQDLRFGWLQQAGAGLFVVYNEIEDLADGLRVRDTPDRSLIVKFSRLVDLLR